MTRYLLDTNIISEAVKPQPSTALARWMEDQDGGNLFIATLTVGEIKRGVLERAPGQRRRLLEAWFAGPQGPEALFRGRILSFDLAAATEWARLMAEGTAAGRSRSALDMIIGAIAVANRCVVVTANERHFENTVAFVNPLRAEA